MLTQDDKLEEAFEIMKSAKNKMEATPDHFDVYGRYVASELRLLKDEHSALMAKYYINNILLESRMGKYKQGYSTAATTPSENQDSVTASNENLYSTPRTTVRENLDFQFENSQEPSVQDDLVIPSFLQE